MTWNMDTASYINNVLTIAGSDSGGGAGIQADLKTITALGNYGMTVITAITAQNTLGVSDYMPVPLDMIQKQFDAVASDIPIHAAKTGMLASSEIVALVVSNIKKYSIPYTVVDPVMVAKGGSTLLSHDAISAVINLLLPVAHVVTPNLHEAEVLTGLTIQTIDDMKKVAKQIHSSGARYVVIKGGHLNDSADDVIYDGNDYTILPGTKINTQNTHGTGCTFSAAIATYLANGYNAIEAIAKAKAFITKAIQFSLALGKGHGPTNHLVDIVNYNYKEQVIHEVEQAFSVIQAAQCGDILVSGSSNIAYALPYPINKTDFALFPGGIITHQDSVFKIKDAACNVEHPLAYMMQKIKSNYRTAINIKNSDAIRAIAHAMDLPVIHVTAPDELMNTGFDKPQIMIVVDDDPLLYIAGQNPSDAAQIVVSIKRRLHEYTS